MLKIKDATGQIVGILRDEDSAPIMIEIFNSKSKKEKKKEEEENVDTNNVNL